MGTAYHTGCGIQHSLQFVGRRTCQDCVAVVNTRRDERMWPQILCQVNAEIAEVDVTNRNWTRWRSRHVGRSSNRTMESGPSCKTGRQPSCWERLCLDPTHSNSVLSAIQWVRVQVHYTLPAGTCTLYTESGCKSTIHWLQVLVLSCHHYLCRRDD